VLTNIFRAMTNDHNDLVNAGRAQVIHAAFNHRAIAEGKQRLKRAHAARAPGGEKNCGDVIQSLGAVLVQFERWHGHPAREPRSLFSYLV